MAGKRRAAKAGAKRADGGTRVKGLFGSMKGTVLKFERPLDPIDAEYDLDRDCRGLLDPHLQLWTD